MAKRTRERLSPQTGRMTYESLMQAVQWGQETENTGSREEEKPSLRPQIPNGMLFMD